MYRDPGYRMGYGFRLILTAAGNVNQRSIRKAEKAGKKCPKFDKKMVMHN
jgi:hypothetical protein